MALDRSSTGREEAGRDQYRPFTSTACICRLERTNAGVGGCGYSMICVRCCPSSSTMHRGTFAGSSRHAEFCDIFVLNFSVASLHFTLATSYRKPSPRLAPYLLFHLASLACVGAKLQLKHWRADAASAVRPRRPMHCTLNCPRCFNFQSRTSPQLFSDQSHLVFPFHTMTYDATLPPALPLARRHPPGRPAQPTNFIHNPAQKKSQRKSESQNAENDLLIWGPPRGLLHERGNVFMLWRMDFCHGET